MSHLSDTSNASRRSQSSLSCGRSISAVLLLMNGIAHAAVIAVVVFLAHPIGVSGFLRMLNGLVYVALMVCLAHAVARNRHILLGAVVSGFFGISYLFSIHLVVFFDFPLFLLFFFLPYGVTLTLASILLIMEFTKAKKQQRTEKCHETTA